MGSGLRLRGFGGGASIMDRVPFRLEEWAGGTATGRVYGTMEK